MTAGTGLAFLQALIDGVHPAPPFSQTTGIYLVEVAEGRVLFKGLPLEGFLNPLGTIHGGWISAILDSAMACAVHSTLRAGQGYTSAEMKVNFVRPLLPSAGELTCEGTVIHRGGTLANEASASSVRASATTPSPRDEAGCGFSPPNSWPGRVGSWIPA